MDLVINEFFERDYADIAEIFAQGIATSNATFETDVPDWDCWNRGHLPECRLAAREGGLIVAWAALSPCFSREAYSGVAEVSLYVRDGYKGRGVGKRLLPALVKESEHCGIWTLESLIFPENAASTALHEVCGFRKVGVREKLGRCPRTGRWRDVLLMERRSAILPG